MMMIWYCKHDNDIWGWRHGYDYDADNDDDGW